MKEETMTLSKSELFFQLISVKIRSQLLYVVLHPLLRSTALMKALCNTAVLTCETCLECIYTICI